MLLGALLSAGVAAQDKGLQDKKAPAKKSAAKSTAKKPAPKPGARQKPTPEQIRKFNELEKKKR
jgi:hypothetical protein